MYEGNDKLERDKYVHELIVRWTENADNKIYVSCVFFTGVFGVITFLMQKIEIKEITNTCLMNVSNWMLRLSFLFMLIAIFIYVRALAPHLKTNCGDKKYPIFFGDIRNLYVNKKKLMKKYKEHTAGVECPRYKDIIKDATGEEFRIELEEEIQTNAEICYDKMIGYRNGLWVSFGAVVLALLSGAARYMMIQ